MSFRSLSVAALVCTVAALPALADQVIADDLIVQGSICTGTDCVDNTAFGFDTVIVSGDAPSMLFRDTSTGTFPTTDWRVGVGGSGTSTFYIENVDTGTPVMQVTGTAVALGGGSELVDGAVSVGASGSERRVTNVADGTDLTDAVTLGQLNAAIAAVGVDAPTTAAILADIEDLDEEVKFTGAVGSAMSSLMVNPRSKADTQVSFGIGGYAGQSAIAFGLFHFLNGDQVMLNTAIAGNPSGKFGVAYRAGATFDLNW